MRRERNIGSTKIGERTSLKQRAARTRTGLCNWARLSASVVTAEPDEARAEGRRPCRRIGDRRRARLVMSEWLNSRGPLRIDWRLWFDTACAARPSALTRVGRGYIGPTSKAAKAQRRCSWPCTLCGRGWSGQTHALLLGRRRLLLTVKLKRWELLLLDLIKRNRHGRRRRRRAGLTSLGGVVDRGEILAQLAHAVTRVDAKRLALMGVEVL